MSPDYKKYIYWVFCSLLLGIPLVFSSRFSEIFEFPKILLLYTAAILVALFFGLDAVKKGVVEVRASVLTIPLLTFLTALFISTLFSLDSRASWLGYYSRFQGGFLSILALTIIFFVGTTTLTQDRVKKLLLWSITSSTIAALWAIGEHFGASVSCLLIQGTFTNECWVQAVQIRPFATFGQPNWLAAWLAAIIPIVIARAQTQSIRSLSLVILTVLVVALLFTKSRSGILGLAVGLGVLTAFTLTAKRQFQTLVGGAIVLVFGIAVIVGTPWSPSLFESKPVQEEVKTDTVLETGGTDSGEIRQIVWTGALDVWKHYPVFGSGVETFADAYFRFRPVKHNATSEWNYLYNKAHNEYLHIAATTGTVGFVAYLVVIGASLFILFPRKKSKDYLLSVGLLSGYVSMLVTNFFGFSVVPISLLTFLFPAFALVLSQNESVRKLHFSPTYWIPFSVAFSIIAGLLGITIIRYAGADLAYNSALKTTETNPQVAQKHISQAISLTPHEALYWDQQAHIQKEAALQLTDQAMAQELALRAQESSDTAYTLAPKRVKLLKSRANLFADLSQISSDYEYAAIDTIEKLAVLSPTDPAVYYSQAIAYARMGDATRSFEAFEKAIALKPDYKRARYAYAVLLNESGNIDEAVHQLQYIISDIDPNDAEVIELLKKLSR